MDLLNNIKKYKEFIQIFEEKLSKKLNIKEENLYDFINKIDVKNGEVLDYQYSFHGGGCTIKKQNTICEYDFIPYSTVFKYQFSTWKLKCFIDTYHNIEIDEKILKKEIEKLVDHNKLTKLKIEGKVFDIYLI